MRKKSEAILDFILAFIGVAILTLGIARIWVWFNVNLAGQQVSYQKSRLLASSPKQFLSKQELANEEYFKEKFPPEAAQGVGSAASIKCPDCWHKPLDLTDKWLFQGQPGDKNTYGGLGLAQFGLIGSVDCEIACKDQPGCGTVAVIDEIDPKTGKCVLIDDPNPTHTHAERVYDAARRRWVTKQVPNKVCRQIRDPDRLDEDNFNNECPCFVHCDCNRNTSLTKTALQMQILQLCTPAAEYRPYRNWLTGQINPGANPRPDQWDSKGQVTRVRFEGCGPVSYYYRDPEGRWVWSKLPTGKAFCSSCSGTNCRPSPNVAWYYNNYSQGFCGQACMLCANADSMDRAADSGCCDPWELCWWFTWGKSCRALHDAARQLRAAAPEIAREGRLLQYSLYKIDQCCNDPEIDTPQKQNACLQDKTLFQSCDDLNQKLEEIRHDIYLLTGASRVKYDGYPYQSIVRSDPKTGQIGCRNFLHDPLTETQLDAAWAALYATDIGEDPVIGTIDLACKLQQEIGYSLDYSHLTYYWGISFDYTNDTPYLHFDGCAAIRSTACQAGDPGVTMYAYTPNIGWWHPVAIRALSPTRTSGFTSAVCVRTASDGKAIDWRRITDARGIYEDGKTTAPQDYINCMNNHLNRSPWWNVNIQGKILQGKASITKAWLPDESGCVMQGALTGVPLLGAIANNCGIVAIWRCTTRQVGLLWDKVVKLEKSRDSIQACCAGHSSDPKIPDNPPPPATRDSIRNSDECNVSLCDTSLYDDCTKWQDDCVEAVVDRLQQECVASAERETAAGAELIYCSSSTGAPPDIDCGSGFFKVAINKNTQACNFSCATSAAPYARYQDSGDTRTYCFTLGELRCYYNCLKTECGYTGGMPSGLPAMVKVKVHQDDKCGIDAAGMNFQCAEYTMEAEFLAYMVSQEEANLFWRTYATCPGMADPGKKPCGGCMSLNQQYGCIDCP